MTKYLGRADTLRLLGRVGFTRLQGRPTVAPKRNLGWDVGNPVPYLKDDIPGGGGEGSTKEVLELGYDLGTTHHLHQMPLMSCIFEGESLCPNGRVPTRGSRILLSVVDMLQGTEVYHYQNPVPDEPDLRSFCRDARPLLLVTWGLNHISPTGPASST